MQHNFARRANLTLRRVPLVSLVSLQRPPDGRGDAYVLYCTVGFISAWRGVNSTAPLYSTYCALRTLFQMTMHCRRYVSASTRHRTRLVLSASTIFLPPHSFYGASSWTRIRIRRTAEKGVSRRRNGDSCLLSLTRCCPSANRMSTIRRNSIASFALQPFIHFNSALFASSLNCTSRFQDQHGNVSKKTNLHSTETILSSLSFC